MNRRRFLASSLLGSTALAVTTAAQALTRQSCGLYPMMPGCQELLRHKSLVADLRVSLAKRGLTTTQIDAVLARAVCPYCGQLLIG